MARLESQSKLGYYPTPERTLGLIISWLVAPGEGLRRYLDPCCGKGEALAAIANGHAESYGIELSDVRASAAEDQLAHVINTGYEYAVLTPETFSLCLANPPYDGEETTGGGRRLEEVFLCDLPTTDVLIPGGVLIYIIPHQRINERIARHLAGWYRDLRCFRLPTGEYEMFKQIVVLAVKRSTYEVPDGETLKATLEWRNGGHIARYDDVEEKALPPKFIEQLEATLGPRPSTISFKDGQPVATKASDDAARTWVARAQQLIADAEQAQTLKYTTRKVRLPVIAPLPDLAAGNGEYLIPETPLKGKSGRPFRFQYQAVSDEDYLREAEEAARRLDAGRDWTDLIPALEPPKIEPAMTPKKGHIALQVSGGLLGTNLVRNPSGRSLLLKGSVDKVQVTKPSADLDAEAAFEDDETDRKKKLRKVEVDEQFRTLLSTLTEEGELSTLADPALIAPLLEQYVGQLAEVVQLRNEPAYNMHPEPWEWAVFEPLSKGRQLPGRKETGLTEFQKHLAIALGRLCLKHGAGFCNAEMGSGKTSIGIAVAEYIRIAQERRGQDETAYPALVVGPGIVTGAENWPKEIVEVTPGAAARVVVVGAKPLPKPAKIGCYLKDLGLELDEERFEGKSATWAFSAICKAAAKQTLQALSSELLAALGESLRRAEKQPPTRRRGAKAPNLLDSRIGGFRWLGLDVSRDPHSEDDLKGKYSLAQFIAEYQAGTLPEKSFAIVSYETAKLGSGRVPAMTTRRIRARWRDEDGKRHSEIQTVCACPRCGVIIADDYDEETGAPQGPVMPAYAEQYVGLKRRFCQAPAPKWVWDADRGKHMLKTHDDDGNRYVCGAPLFENSGLRRIAAADYARKKAHGVFGLCLTDEVHRCKAKGTGVGLALTALSNAARYTIGLTGTLFGGQSTSIFWLLYRLCPEVRQSFAFNDERRWTERYGLLKHTFYTDKDAGEVDEDGAFTGTKFFETVSERPGISPAIAGVGLKYCTFSSLKDVGLPLPHYTEEIVRLDLTPAMKDQYARADGSAEKKGLFAWALGRMEDEDGQGAISVWLNTALNRPDAMFRGEHVVFHPRVSGRGRFAVRRTESVATFEPVVLAGEWLPKEEWTARTCLAELQLGRKTLVYVRQTGERDIQERLAECLTARGLRVSVLRPSLAPEKRGPWIKKHADEFDVLLTNARLVEVGLNLTMLSTAIFFEMEWSLYVTWQAMRRLYRPGAQRGVKLYFPVYRYTLEESALDLIGAKMLAAMCFYGDEASGSLVDESDQGNLLNDIVRKAMGELQVGRAEGIFSLGNDMLVTESPLGSPTAISPRVITFAELALRRRELVQSARRVKRLTASDDAHTQPTLF